MRFYNTSMIAAFGAEHLPVSAAEKQLVIAITASKEAKRQRLERNGGAQDACFLPLAPC
jgi:hypothetical protein